MFGKATMCLKMKKRIWELIFTFCVFFGHLALPLHGNPDGPVYVPGGSTSSSSVPKIPDTELPLPTVTVRGFLNFRTTVDGTVIVFTPASEAPQDPTPSFASSSSSLSSASKISSRSDDVQHITYKDRNELITTELENEANTGEDRDTLKQLKSGLSGDFTTPEDPGNPLQKPNFGPTPALPQYPTGLVTVLGGTHVKDGATTVYETKVIGTYIDGKYAQILQSTSQIIFSATKSDLRLKELTTPKPSPSKPELQSIKFSTSTTNSKVFGSSTTPIRQRPTPGTSTTKDYRNPTTILDRQAAERRKDDAVDANAVLQTSFKLPDVGPNINRISRPTQSLEKSLSRSSYVLSRRFRPTSTIVATDVLDDENTVPEFQNTRRLPPRFRYVLPRRTSPTVRLNRFKVKLTVRNDGGSTDSYVTPHDTTFDPDEELDYDPLQPVDPARVTYEKTTITSEVTLHVGRRKSVRTLTITTSVPRTKHVTDILRHHHDIHPANNNAIFATTYLDGEDPQNIVTRTYTTTERMLKTSIVPVLDGNLTSYHTVTESFFILKLITGYKTLLPSDVTLITSDPTDMEMESDSTVMPDSEQIDGLLDGAIPLDISPAYHRVMQTPVPNGLLQASGSGREQAVVPLGASGKAKQLELSNSLLSLGAALQQNPLAAVYLGLQQLNRQATLYSTITKASTYVATDTIYSTKVVSIYDGRRTRTRTLSESLSTTERTMTTYTTTVTPYLNTQLFPQQNLQQLLGTQLNGGVHLPPPPPQFSTLTSTVTKVTTATSLSTRIYTLIYNALSTKFRTVTSTSLYETTVTITSTSEVPIAITAPPGGVFPFLG